MELIDLPVGHVLPPPVTKPIVETSSRAGEK